MQVHTHTSAALNIPKIWGIVKKIKNNPNKERENKWKKQQFMKWLKYDEKTGLITTMQHM